ncbi:MAG: hypothetical protein GF307_01780 [candidate division Zixibacteria bacterium]|nr:hypothetical protein [candidate division Zixibacteria bacterium]
MMKSNPVTTVLFLWNPKDELRGYLTDRLKKYNDVRLIFPEEGDDEKFYFRHAPEADVIVGWRPTEELLEKAYKLKLFINPGAGVQRILPMFREVNKTRDVVLVNGHGNSYFTAEHIVALLLAMLNKVVPHHNWMVEGKWRMGDNNAVSIPLRDKNVGLLGYGAVNKKVHRFLSGFDVRFSILRKNWDKLTESLPTEVAKYEPGSLHNFLRAIDMLIIAIPQTEETIGLIGKDELELLGRDSFLVNAGRGIIVDEVSLYNALKNGVIAGAAIDVWYDYQPDEDTDGRRYPCNFPFHELDNIILSPHRAASPFSDLKRWDEVIENIGRFADGRDNFLNVVNLTAGY